MKVDMPLNKENKTKPAFFTAVWETASPQVCILAHNAVFWLDSTRPLISKSTSPCINVLVTVPSAPITIDIIVTFTFHSFSVLWQGPHNYLSFRFPSVLPSGQPERQSPLLGRFSFLLTITSSSRLAEIRWSVCISKSQKILCVSFSRTDSGLCIYHVSV